jgi:DNA replication and repair protein RecF
MISEIKLMNFRNFAKKTFKFSKKTTVIVGPNASGKTNILESIFLLSTGKSFRAKKEEEMVSYDAEVTRVVGALTGGEQKTEKLEVVLTRGMVNIGKQRPERVPRKKLLVNGVSRRLFNFAGNLKVVLFGPWDMHIVTEAPSIRRKFMDVVLSQVDREYRRSFLSYEKGLRQRNKLLWQIREEGLPRESLVFWDQLLIKDGNYLSQKRAEFIEFVNDTPDFNGHDFSLEYDRSAISEARLEEYKEEEIAAATTLVGPHRDDFLFRLLNLEKRERKARDLDKFGSRGEQRMGVLWLKLAEMAFIKEATEEKPTLLLDDIFSELDYKHRDIVIGVTENQQTVITTTDEHFVKDLSSAVTTL